jgi:hypothetical protein
VCHKRTIRENFKTDPTGTKIGTKYQNRIFLLETSVNRRFSLREDQKNKKSSPLSGRFFTVPCSPTGCRGNQRVLFRTRHKLWLVSDDVMFVSMPDVIVGYLRPPDESGGYRMTDVSVRKFIYVLSVLSLKLSARISLPGNQVGQAMPARHPDSGCCRRARHKQRAITRVKPRLQPADNMKRIRTKFFLNRQIDGLFCDTAHRKPV